ncbi:YdaS family helix-turn-helix protein [Ralstonia thomasii]|jgi:DNA-binding transcriptional regulator YdaS (Cro superfamily)
MDLKTYVSTAGRGTASRLADLLGVSRSYLAQMSSGASPISAERCVAIERATDGAVTRKDLRPNDWHLIWPELADIPPQDASDDVQPPVGTSDHQESDSDDGSS